MTEWLMKNLPGMLLGSALESFVVTLVIYSLCAVLVFYRGMKGIRGLHLLAVFTCLLFVQGALNLFFQILFPSTEPLGVSVLLRILVSPAILSGLALIVLKNRARLTSP